MLGVAFDTILTLIGSSIGFFFSKRIPEKWSDSVMKGLALCVMFIGIMGIIQGKNVLSIVVSMLIGILIGSWLDPDTKLEKLSKKINEKFKREDGKASIAAAFVDGSIICCVGAMTTVGCLEAGISGDSSILILKAAIDMITMLIFAATMGMGVIFVAGFIFVFEGAFVLLAQFLEPVLSQNVIADMGCTGALLILAIGFNLMGLTKIKITNYILAIFLPIGFTPLFELIQGQ